MAAMKVLFWAPQPCFTVSVDEDPGIEGEDVEVRFCTPEWDSFAEAYLANGVGCEEIDADPESAYVVTCWSKKGANGLWLEYAIVARCDVDDEGNLILIGEKDYEVICRELCHYTEYNEGVLKMAKKLMAEEETVCPATTSSTE